MPAAEAAGADGKVVETHTAVLQMDGEVVRKTKKAVDLGFLDLTTVEARRRACEEEVRLNRRLAPDVYLGVEERPGPDGTREPAVLMRRMPDDRRLATLVAERADAEATAALDSVARQLVHLHESEPPDPARNHLGTTEALRRRWHESSSRLRPLLAGEPLAEIDAEVLRRVDAYLDGRGPLFDARVREGKIRDGHGDLRAEDIFVVDGRTVILDCIEFDADYRWGDVLADVAFLAMDLRLAQRDDLAQHLLVRYRELSDDRWPPSLLEHFVAYRAHVRATVGALRAAQHGEDPVAAAEPYLHLAEEALRRGGVRLVVVGGAPGSGKTTVAARLAQTLGAVHVSSDGVRPTVPEAADPAHRYEATAKQAVYAEMRRRTRLLLEQGEHVVFDATCSEVAERERLRALAAEAHVVVDEVRCVVPTLTAVQRVSDRTVRGAGMSEVTAVKAMEMAAEFPDWPEAVVLDTDGTIEQTLDRARRILSISESDPSSRWQPSER